MNLSDRVYLASLAIKTAAEVAPYVSKDERRIAEEVEREMAKYNNKNNYGQQLTNYKNKTQGLLDDFAKLKDEAYKQDQAFNKEQIAFTKKMHKTLAEDQTKYNNLMTRKRIGALRGNSKKALMKIILANAGLLTAGLGTYGAVKATKKPSMLERLGLA